MAEVVLDHRMLRERLDVHRARGETTVLTNGIFDLLHVGHVRYIEGARAEGEVLVVAINDDRAAALLKGDGHPILPQAERLEMIAALDAPSYVTLFSEKRVDRLLETLRPDVHAKGTDYTPETVPERETMRRLGGRVAIVGDPKRHSTSSLIERVTAARPGTAGAVDGPAPDGRRGVSSEARPGLSVCVITLNEEENIGPCLETVRWADEIIVVDSFSTDKTVEIAKQYTDLVFQRHWEGINRQRSFALDKARGPWIFSLDADERVSPELGVEIRRVLTRGDAGPAGYRLRRRTAFFGRWLLHGGHYPDAKLRLFCKEQARYAGRDPHDKVEVTGAVGDLDGDILHFSYRSFSDNLARVESFSEAAAEQMAEEGKRFSFGKLLFRPPFKFVKCYLLQRGFLDGIQGFIMACISSFYVFIKYAKLWEIERGRRGAGSGHAPDESASP